MGSDIFKSKSGNVTVTRFAGKGVGKDYEGQYVQITVGAFFFIQFTAKEFDEMVSAFTAKQIKVKNAEQVF